MTFCSVLREFNLFMSPNKSNCPAADIDSYCQYHYEHTWCNHCINILALCRVKNKMSAGTYENTQRKILIRFEIKSLFYLKFNKCGKNLVWTQCLSKFVIHNHTSLQILMKQGHFKINRFIAEYFSEVIRFYVKGQSMKNNFPWFKQECVLLLKLRFSCMLLRNWK